MMAQKKIREAKSKKSILVLSTFFLPKLGGVEIYNRELFSRLDATYHIDLVCCNTQHVADQEKRGNILVHRIPSWNLLGSAMPRSWPRTLRFLAALHKRNSYDLVVTHTRFFVLSYLGAYFAKKHNMQHIHIEHGGAPLSHKNPLVKLIATLFDATMGKYIIKNASSVAGISQNTQRFVKTFGRTSELILYNGVDTKKFSKPQTNILRKKHALDKDKKIIGYLGRLVYAKGVHHLVEAYLQLSAKEQEKSTLIIGGDGPEMQNLKTLAKNHPHIQFWGSIEPEHVPEFLHMLDIFVNPSYNEGLPTTVLEAGAAQCTLIATDVGGTREIIKNASLGYLIPAQSTQAVKQALKSTLSSPSKGLKAQKYIKETFDWDVLAKEFTKKVSL